jgi:cation:H+ antiporter
MDIVTISLFVLGGVMLALGSEWLVRGASRFAAAIGVSPLVIGLTVVAFGTGSPELAVGVSSAAEGRTDVALGNVVGSNVFNVLVVLGAAAVFAPLAVSERLVRNEVVIMIALSAGVFLLALNGELNRFQGCLLLFGLAAFLLWSFRKARQERPRTIAAPANEVMAGAPPGAGRNVALVAIGLGLLILGSHWFVDGAVEFAEALGVSELVIGLTIVAIGTSLPELATSVAATIRGERDIAVGNVVGSNIFNLLAVLGATALVAPHGIPVAGGALRFDLPLLVVTAAVCLPIFFTGGVVNRREGLLFLAFYAAYVLYLLLDSSGHDGLHSYRLVMLGFVLPLTALTMAVLVFQTYRRGGPLRWRIERVRQRRAAGIEKGSARRRPPGETG